MTLRPVLVVLHRYVGLATAIFLVVIGISGALLAWLHPLEALLAPELHEAPGRGAVLAPEALVAAAQAAEPHAAFSFWPLDLREGEGVHVFVAPAVDPLTRQPYALGYDRLWLDPVSGAVLGRVDSQALPPTHANLMDFIYRLHYALALPGRWGLWIVGIVALLWFLDCFVGAVLTFPRGRPFLARWRPAWGVKSRRLTYDLHRAGGLWPWLLLATIALSGIYFNLRSELFLPVFDRIATRTLEPYDSRAPDAAAQRAAPATVGLTQAIATAVDAARGRGWTLPAESAYHQNSQGFWQINFAKAPRQWATAGSYAVFVDDASGAVFHVREPGGTGGDRFLAWLIALHLGTVFGTPYKVVLTLIGLATASLSVTGVLLWWRKRRHRVRSRRTSTVAAPAAPLLRQTP